MTLGRFLRSLIFKKEFRIAKFKENDSYEDLFSFIEKNCIGRDLIFQGPYGKLPVTYCDYTASGRSLHFIEDYIRNEVLPRYGNTHTTTGITSLQTTYFRSQARDVIRKSVNAKENDAVIFVGSGVTGAVHKLIHALNFQIPPVVFVGPYEHHSNLLPWKEIGGEVVWTLEDDEGKIDIHNLEQNLSRYKDCNRPLVGSFSAGSNITGILTDVDEIAAVLHRYDAVAFFDYATAAPYVKIDMNPTRRRNSDKATEKDAVFISTHKFVGGPGTPGILIAKKKLFRNPVPSNVGGGTVISVTQSSHRYYQDVETKEEGGTPSIVESIRAGLVFQLKEAIGAVRIITKEHELVRKALDFWKDVSSLVILGNSNANRLPIFSMLIYHQKSGKLLHHNFVCAVLNDVFGIQARGGCACAGPYAEGLLGMDEELALRYAGIIVKEREDSYYSCGEEHSEVACEILKPGFTRLNLPYFLCDEGIKYVLAAVKMVAEHGWKLMTQYDFNKRTAEWRHQNDKMVKSKKCIDEIAFKKGRMTYPRDELSKSKVPSYKKRLKRAKRIFKKACRMDCISSKENEGVSVSANETTFSKTSFDDEEEKLRWFLLPSEAVMYLDGKHEKNHTFQIPFTPKIRVKKEADHSQLNVHEIPVIPNLKSNAADVPIVEID